LEKPDQEQKLHRHQYPGAGDFDRLAGCRRGRRGDGPKRLAAAERRDHRRTHGGL